MPQKNKFRIYCYLDNALGRDTEIVLPVAYFLEKYGNCEVKFHFLWDIVSLRKGKPDAVLLPNTVGHNVYVEIAKYAYQANILVFALESEGNFRTDGTHYYWGYNKEEFFFQEWITTWSNRTKEYLRGIAKNKLDKLVVTGGTGFDRYQFSKFAERHVLLSKYGKENYKKVIGYAGWAFGKLYNPQRDKAFNHIKENPEEALKWVEEQRVHVREVLKKLIAHNSDILFLFKRHPKESFESDLTHGPNEMNELLDYDNVLYLSNEEMIHDLVNICDLWTGFETTTALEAWLLNKQTFLINKEVNFVRDQLHKGSLIVKDQKQAQDLIDEHFNTGKIEAFHAPELMAKREALIEDAIGFKDGKNHIRAGRYCCISLQNRNKKVKRKPAFSLRHLRLYYLMHLGKYFYSKKVFQRLPGFKKSIYVFENMYLPGFEQRKNEVYQDLDLFYEARSIDQLITVDKWDELF